MDSSAALSDIKLDESLDEIKEEEEEKIKVAEGTTDDKVEEDKEEKTEEKENDSKALLEDESNVTIKSQSGGSQWNRPKSVLKNKTPTPVITTTTTTVNNDISNAHRDRECCTIS